MSKKKRVVGTIGSALAVAAMLLAVLTPAPDAAAQDSKPSLAITEVNLDNSTIVITNNGSAEADPNGIILCNFPAYGPIAGAAMIPAGGSITVNTADAGVPLDPTQGEMGLYLTAAYEDPTQLISYMEYGEGGHRRAPVAVSAGIWSDGFGPGGGGILKASNTNPTSPADWTSSAASAGGAATTELAVTGTNPTLIWVGSAAVLGGLGLVIAGRKRLDALG